MRKLLALVMLMVLLPGAWAQAQTDPLAQAVTYMRTQQAADGTFAGFGAGSTADAVYALVAAGQDPAQVAVGGVSALDGLRKLGPATVKEPGLAAKFALAFLMAGQAPVVTDANLLNKVEQSFDPATGQYGKDLTGHAFAVLALHAAGRGADNMAAAVAALKKLQLADGGWGFDGTAKSGSDTNTTSVIIQALIAAGDTSDAVTKAVAYLKTQQNDDGGFPYSQTSQFGTASDANSTAYTIQALLAAGEDLAKISKAGKTPRERLVAFQNPSGAFRYQDTPPDDNAAATYQAIAALAGKTFPLTALPAPAPAPTAAAGATATPTEARPTDPLAPTATAVAAPGTTATAAAAPGGLPDTAGKSAPAWPLAALALLLVGSALLVRRRAA